MIKPTNAPCLVLEDSDEDFDTWQEAIRRAGLNVVSVRVTTGNECVAYVRDKSRQTPAFIVIDLNTPGIDGREALKLIKGESESRDIPVVVLTTSDNPKDIRECYRNGANAYHQKPTRFPEHKRLVVQLVEYWWGAVILPGGRKNEV